MRLSRKKYRNLSDEGLLKLFDRTPMKVIEELYRRYSVLCYGLALKYLKNRPESKDAVNDIFIRLRFDLEKYQIKSFRSWFYTYSRNHCLGILRKRMNDADLSLEIREDQTSDIKEKLRLERQLLQLEEAIADLKSDQQNCLRAFYFEKKSYDEISRQFGISINKVKSNLQNAKRNLKIKLQNDSVRIASRK